MEKPKLRADQEVERNSSSQLERGIFQRSRGVWSLLQLWSLCTILICSAAGSAWAQSDGCNRTNTTHPAEGEDFNLYSDSLLGTIFANFLVLFVAVAEFTNAINPQRSEV